MQPGNDVDSLGAMPRAVPNLDIRPAGQETLVYEPASGKVHVLNAVAARILRSCDGTAPLERIIDDLVSSTGAERERVTADVLRVCNDFRKQGLLS